MGVGARYVIFGLGLLLASPLYPQNDSPQEYTGRQLRELERNAKTPEEHRRLAAYYRGRERSFRLLEAEQRRLLSEYNEASQNSGSKYPTRGHSARHLASYYAEQAEKASQAAAKQEHNAKEHESLKTLSAQ